MIQVLRIVIEDDALGPVGDDPRIGKKKSRDKRAALNYVHHKIA
jgi:hypothetical protein